MTQPSEDKKYDRERYKQQKFKVERTIVRLGELIKEIETAARETGHQEMAESYGKLLSLVVLLGESYEYLRQRY